MNARSPSPSERGRLSRRDVLLRGVSCLVASSAAVSSAALGSLLGCDSGEVAPPARPQPAPVAKSTASGGGASKGAPSAGAASAGAPLDVLRLGPLREDEKGGLLVVLLHGWRARGDDLAPLARELARPGQRFLVPAAPLAEPNGGRAWWRLDGGTRPAHAYSDQMPDGYPLNTQLLAARQAVQALLRDAQRRYAPDAIALAGFSQGAMLALDVALAADPPVARVAALSGTLLVDSLPSLRTEAPSPPAVFVAHGRGDTVLPFAAGSAIPTVLSAHGWPVTFFPFEGGHQIPPDVVRELRAFLAPGSR